MTKKDLAEKLEKFRSMTEERIVKLTETVEDLKNMGELRRTFLRGASSALIISEDRALFKARVGKSGRVVIPEPERAALALEKGDLVQIDLSKIEKKKKNKSN